MDYSSICVCAAGRSSKDNGVAVALSDGGAYLVICRIEVFYRRLGSGLSRFCIGQVVRPARPSAKHFYVREPDKLSEIGFAVNLHIVLTVGRNIKRVIVVLCTCPEAAVKIVYGSGSRFFRSDRKLHRDHHDDCCDGTKQ